MAGEGKAVELYLSSVSLLPPTATGIIHNSVALITRTLERCRLSSKLLLLLSLQYFVDLNLFQNCPPLFSGLRLTLQFLAPVFVRYSTDSS